LKHPGVDGRIILKLILIKWYWRGEMDCIDLAFDRDRWQAVVNVMNFWVP
jgi:hypothetical protein